MARISLKNIVGKKNEINAAVLALISLSEAGTLIEDEKGNVIAGIQHDQMNSSFPVVLEDEILGWVKGDEKSVIIADLLTNLLQRESEKKKLGSEVLNLYQEVNLIFNFSDKLAQTIEPAAIAKITL